MLARTPNKRKLIIAAISSRPYVEAAVAAGYEVFAIDAFNDVDTLACVNLATKVELIDGQFDSSVILAILESLVSTEYLGFCYGAGFERSPDLLDQIAKRVPLLGNTSANLLACKSPDVFFDICEQLEITYPPIRFDTPQEESWIYKRIGACGGGHITPVKQVSTKPNDGYYQKIQVGMPIACLFIASAAGVTIVGIHEQWVSATDFAPYRYGGAVSHADISLKARKKFEKYVSLLAERCGLIGLCSCDAILNGDEVYVLEINPRLSASIDLYQLTDANLMDLHVRACLGERLPGLKVQGIAKAHQIVYAMQQTIWQQAHCPEWLRDRPTIGTLIETGDAICTVTAQADSANQAKALAMTRAQCI